MSRMINSEKVRALSVVLAAFMLAAILFSSLFIALEMHHDCSGEDCPICICIEHCVRTLHELGDLNVLCAVSVLPVLLIVFAKIATGFVYVNDTPVSRKVRMND